MPLMGHLLYECKKLLQLVKMHYNMPYAACGMQFVHPCIKPYAAYYITHCLCTAHLVNQLGHYGYRELCIIF